MVGKPNNKVLIFVSNRSVAFELQSVLKQYLSAEVGILIGQKGGKGMTQTEQEAIFDQFAQEKFQFLIATQVAEVGLDFDVNMVISYEPPIDYRELIQRMGRVSRHTRGKFLILATDETIEVPMWWKTRREHRKMEQWIHWYQRQNPYHAVVKPRATPELRQSSVILRPTAKQRSESRRVFWRKAEESQILSAKSRSGPATWFGGRSAQDDKIRAKTILEIGRAHV